MANVSRFKTEFTNEQIGAHDIILPTKRGRNSTTTSANKRLRSNNNDHVPIASSNGDSEVPPDFPIDNDEQHEAHQSPPINEAATPAAVHLPTQRQPTIATGRSRSGRNIRQPQRLITVKRAMRPDSSSSHPDETLLDQLH